MNDIKLYFTYSDKNDYNKHIDIVNECFSVITISCDDTEKIASVYLNEFNSSSISDYLSEFDDELRIIYIADMLIMGLDSMLCEVGL